MKNMRRKLLVYSCCLMVGAAIMMFLMFTAEFSMNVVTDGNSIVIVDSSVQTTMTDFPDDIKDMQKTMEMFTELGYTDAAFGVWACWAARIFMWCAILVTYLGAALAVVVFLYALFLFFSKKEEVVTIDDWKSFDSALYVAPLFAFIAVLIPTIVCGLIINDIFGSAVKMEFEFIGGVNYLFTAIGAFILPKICRFFCKNFL